MTTWIIVPAYKSAAFLPDTIASIRRQTAEDWRAVIVDDGSPDDGAAIAADAARADCRILLVRQENAGVSAARNRGREVALADPACDSLLFLDADDMLRPDALETLRAALWARPGIPAVHGLASFVDESGVPTRAGELEVWCRRRQVPSGRGLRNLGADEPSSFASLVCVHGIPTTGVVLMARAASEAAGGFDVSIPETSDWEMWVRLGHWGDLPRLNKVVLDYRVHENNMSRDVARMNRAVEAAWRRIWNSQLNKRSERAAIRRGYRRWHLYMASRKPVGAIQLLLRGQSQGAAKELAYGANHVRRALKRNPGELPGPVSTVP